VSVVSLGSTFSRPISVVVRGSNRPLLNWVALALATEANPQFIWNDVRLRGEKLSDLDPLARDLIPTDRLNIAVPTAFVPDHAAASTPTSGVIRDDEPSDNIRLLKEFLRLPQGAQRLLSMPPAGDRPTVLVLSNAHRLVAVYPSETLAPVLTTLTGAGVTLIMTFADAGPESHRAFDVALEVEGNDPKEWRGAVIRVEQGPLEGPLRPGSRYPLGDFQPAAGLLARELG